MQTSTCKSTDARLPHRRSASYIHRGQRGAKDGEVLPGWWCGDGPGTQPTPLARRARQPRAGPRHHRHRTGRGHRGGSGLLDRWPPFRNHPSGWPSPPSWCYGTPGLARVQQLAGLALADPRPKRPWPAACRADCCRPTRRVATDLMLDQPAVRPGDRILETGVGTGYAALLAHLTGPAGHVTTVDIDEDLTAQDAVRLLAVRVPSGCERQRCVVRGRAELRPRTPGG